MKIKKTVLVIFFILIELGILIGGLQYVKKTAAQSMAVKNELIAWQRKDEDLLQLQENYYKNERAITLINQALPANTGVIPFFEELESQASQSGITVSIEMTGPPTEDTGQNLVMVALRLTVKGTIGRVQTFIKRLETLDQFIIIRQAVLNSPDGLSDEINGTILIKTYFAK